ncbi:PREDICTED: sperm flagellar protein 1-like isoform X2 [Chinchilla lanigera]|uniref:Sperm flagellar protein 1-like n=1 Tax=Chinchilla lanigera TaxID=34839 RepID=A0A8C2UUS4_CHILA|nr:PREDICTED: sperm flagellar protein 1-like isoform X2 [Chinchilla lanigera]
MPGASRLSPAAPSPTRLLRGLCAWLDRLPLSRPKRHLARDFSDGVLVAEIVKHFHPRLVDLHSYIPACSTDQKLSNWSLLNRKVFHKLHFCVSEADIRKVVANVPGAIEPILCALREKVEAGTVHAGSPSTTGTGPSYVNADQPCVELPTCTYTGLPHSPDPSSVKTLQNQGALEKMDCCACGCGDPAREAWEHLARAQQLLEDKEQALVILQQTVQILQMKVMRLENLVQLKDQRIEELMRPGPEECQGSPGDALLGSSRP